MQESTQVAANEDDGLSQEDQRVLYRSMLLPRMIEERMLLLLRQGKISKWFSGIGQEAIAAAATLALEPDEFILPLHRNLGVFTTRGVSLHRLFSQFQGKLSGFTNGRDRSFHFGSPEHFIVGMISHLGPSLAVADGIALACKLGREKKVALVFCGDGGTSQGDVHEAMNVAAVWDLPVIFLIENNGYGLSTPVSEQYRCERLSDRATGYGFEGVTVDGNNVEEVFHTVESFATQMRENPKPVLIECNTFRVRGHEEASGVKYVPPELIEEWKEKDPVKNYEATLLARGVLSVEEIEQLRAVLAEEIEAGLESALNEPDVLADTERETRAVFAQQQISITPPTEPETELRFVDAVGDAIRQGLNAHHKLVIMGQDVAGYGGVFKVTEGLLEEFGAERIRNTPLCESAILGNALGLSIKGWKSVVEMQFSDFVSSGFTQIINNLAKVHYRWGQQADVVVRMPAGAGVGAGPFHSQTNEAWFAHTAGLKVFYPAFPRDAKGLLLTAIEDPNPVLFFEHKWLYRRIKQQVPQGYYTLEAGKASTVQSGEQVSIISYGAGVHWALELAEKRPDLSLNIIDLRTLVPLDKEALVEAARKTGKVLVLTEASMNCGFGAELAAWIGERCFEYLDAPVVRCASLDTPVPFAADLERDFLALSRLESQVEDLIAY